MRHFFRGKRKLLFVLCMPLLLAIVYITPFTLRFIIGYVPMGKCLLEPGEKLKLGNRLDDSLDLWTRSDVQTCTDWGAPIIWEGMFSPSHYDQGHRQDNATVALTVFAVGKYLDAYLERFLVSAELHFMVALPVTYYVFTDAPERVPVLQLGRGRSVRVVRVQRHSRWQDVSMMRMRAIADTIETYIRHHSRYVFCMDVDQEFVGRFGSEALGDLVALLHAYYYHMPRGMFTYDRNPRSRACMRTGDYYYHAAVFGGSWESVRNLTEWCYRAIVEDRENNVEALWQDESHLNKYLWLHKPSRLLSPEYCWDTLIGRRGDIRQARLLWAEKHYNTLRNPVEG